MLAPFVLMPFAVGALGGYGLSFLGLFGRIVCSGILFIHAIIISLTLAALIIGHKPGDSRQWIGAGGLTETISMALAFDSAMILSGRLSGLMALDWTWAGGGAAITLASSVTLAWRHMEARQRRLAGTRLD
jgi:hypothetical protein